MAAWLFQTVDRSRIELIETGRVEHWCVRRYRSEMQEGDIVLIWHGGSPAVRGVHGWGRLVAAPHTDPTNHTAQVDVRYEQRIAPFLSAIELRKHPTLHALPVLQMPRATNFRLDNAQAAALVDLISVASHM